MADLTSLREGRVAKWGGVGCFITREREKKLLDRGIGGLSLVYDVFPGPRAPPRLPPRTTNPSAPAPRGALAPRRLAGPLDP